MKNKFETYFARHTETIAIDDATRNRLWAEKRIAIHYPFDISGDTTQDSRSIEPKDYPQPARKNIKALRNLAQNGGYVCAQYFGHEECVLGFVEPQSHIELVEGNWGKNERQGRVADWKGRTAILKTLLLTKVRIVAPEKHAIILVGRPRQGTLMRWPSSGKVIEELVEGRKSEIRLTDLSPSRQEIMCSEFLRLPEAKEYGLPVLKHLILPVGRTMKDVDITALSNDGSIIYAQITLHTKKNALHKLQRLNHYGKNHLILFCRCEEISIEKGVIIFPIEKAFEVFCASDLGHKWLHA